MAPCHSGLVLSDYSNQVGLGLLHHGQPSLTLRLGQIRLGPTVGITFNSLETRLRLFILAPSLGLLQKYKSKRIAYYEANNKIANSINLVFRFLMMGTATFKSLEKSELFEYGTVRT